VNIEELFKNRKPPIYRIKVQNTIGKNVALSTCGIVGDLGVEGIEPSMAVPKTAALPLGYTPEN
jgi:hypothetical protein